MDNYSYMRLIYLLLSSITTYNKGAVKNNSKASSGKSGTGTVGPTADWKGSTDGDWLQVRDPHSWKGVHW